MPFGGVGNTWVNGVYCQRFGQMGPLQRLFAVVSASRKETSPEVKKSIMPYFEKLRRKIQKKNEKTATEIHEQGRFSGNMWLKRTK
jgi:hypothetical protein